MKIQHPAFPDIVKDVKDVESWLRAGWLKVEAEVEHVVDLTRRDDEDDES